MGQRRLPPHRHCDWVTKGSSTNDNRAIETCGWHWVIDGNEPIRCDGNSTNDAGATAKSQGSRSCF